LRHALAPTEQLCTAVEYDGPVGQIALESNGVMPSATAWSSDLWIARRVNTAVLLAADTVPVI